MKNVFLDHKNLVYATTLSEYQRVMHWRLILEEFWPNIQHLSGVDNILADTLSILQSTSVDKYYPITSKSQCHANELFAMSSAENNEYCFPLNLLNVQREQQKYLRKVNSKLSTYISDRVSGYSKQALENVKRIFYDSKMYVPKSLHRRVLDWYHFYLKHPGGGRLAKTIRGVCY